MYIEQFILLFKLQYFGIITVCVFPANLVEYVNLSGSIFLYLDTTSKTFSLDKSDGTDIDLLFKVFCFIPSRYFVLLTCIGDVFTFFLTANSSRVSSKCF